MSKTETSTATPALPANFRYRDENGKMISKEVAKTHRWAAKETGLPTLIYKHRLVVREAVKNGTTVPVRAKKTYEAGSQAHAEIASPYDLARRSGYRTIWQVLAENANEFVTIEALTAEVNDRLQKESPKWYNGRYADVAYDVEANAYVMTRAPYNDKIEAMAQRVTQEADGFMLMTEVATPRVLKKRGRKPKAVEAPVEAPALDATVETDDDTSVAVTDEVAVTA